jgi:hypothetical protein
MAIPELLDKLRRTGNCFVHAPTGVPATGMALPADLEQFYRLAGGAVLFSGEAFSIEIVPPGGFVRANPVLAGEAGEDDISYNWFIVARQHEQIVTIDLAPERLGRCYDSFWDRHGVKGESQIVARSFESLLAQLIETKGAHWYWLRQTFEHLGDAYDGIIDA